VKISCGKNNLLLATNAVPHKIILFSGKSLTNQKNVEKKLPEIPGAYIKNSPLTHLSKTAMGKGLS
jgi:hypothetical protein